MDINSILSQLSSTSLSVTKTRNGGGNGNSSAARYQVLEGDAVKTAILSSSGAVSQTLRLMLWHNTMLPVNYALVKGEMPDSGLLEEIQKANTWLAPGLHGKSLQEVCEDTLMAELVPMEKVTELVLTSRLLDSQDPENQVAHTARLQRLAALEMSTYGVRNPYGIGMDRLLESFALMDIGLAIWGNRALMGTVGKFSNISAYIRTPLLDNNPSNKLWPKTGKNPQTGIPVIRKVA